MEPPEIISLGAVLEQHEYIVMAKDDPNGDAQGIRNHLEKWKCLFPDDPDEILLDPDVMCGRPHGELFIATTTTVTLEDLNNDNIVVYGGFGKAPSTLKSDRAQFTKLEYRSGRFDKLEGTFHGHVGGRPLWIQGAHRRAHMALPV